MKLNSKCEFNVGSIEILGHVVDHKGLSPNPDLVRAINEAPTPTNRDQVKSFLGLVGYYSKFIRHFAKRVQHIRNTMVADAFEWTKEAQVAFQAVKHEIINSTALALFDPDRETIVTTDASGYGVGSVMTQIQGGQEVTVCFASRKLTAAEQKYSVGEREALACVWAIEKWHTYLWGRPFVLRPYHRALTTLLATSGTGHRPMRIARWATRLCHYNYTVEYKPGIENKVADALSRLPVEHNPAIGVVDDDDDDIAGVCQTVLQESSVTCTQLQSETNRDEACQTIKGYIQQGWPQSKSGVDDKVKPYYSVHDELSVHDNIIFRGEKVVVPTGLTSIIVSRAHEGHQGMVRTKQRIRKLYWWPGMDNQVTTMVKHCATCNLADKSVSIRVAPMQPVPLPECSWDKLGLDIVGQDETAPLGCRFAITLIDYKSKWPEVVFTDTVTSSTVIEFLLTVFGREERSKEIVTDHGVQFTSHECNEFLRSRNIVHRMSAIYHPQGNSTVERFNRVFKGYLQTARLENTSARISVYLQEYPSCYNGGMPKDGIAWSSSANQIRYSGSIPCTYTD
ncbi:hypothetical protein BSL78_09811 [Apostichopus japonicus]|uniref:Integrase catalytic domain-containing protein n=1 Tax=Stichopus japonicus TaxID=307972 RepID=A0A2G8KZ34_STIJA|nr:hypothetical protein BSL78_09811 [Apostichopus japonicus]